MARTLSELPRSNERTNKKSLPSVAANPADLVRSPGPANDDDDDSNTNAGTRNALDKNGQGLDRP
jgi:hypothetical protein